MESERSNSGPMTYSVGLARPELRIVCGRDLKLLILRCQELSGLHSTSEFIRKVLAEEIERTLGIPADQILADIPTRDLAVKRKGKVGRRPLRTAPSEPADA